MAKKAKKTKGSKAGKTSKAKKASTGKSKPKAKKISLSKPRYQCAACGVMITITEEGLGVHRLMCCGQPMKRV